MNMSFVYVNAQYFYGYYFYGENNSDLCCSHIN